MQQTEIKKILNEKVKSGSWQLKDSPAGKSKTSYIAVLEDLKVFVKLESTNNALVRLSEIGITPKIIYVEENIIIQEFINGDYPTSDWIADNYDKFAKLIYKYHSDKKLKDILKKRISSDSEAPFTTFLKEVRDWEKQIDGFSNDERAKNHLEKLVASRPKDISDLAMPIHADPNICNFILKDNKIYSVDWDDIQLSDPLRDIGQFAWNYIPENKWELFVKECGFDFTAERKYRFFWWISILKLFVGFWFYIYQKDTDTYKKYLAESIEVADEYLFTTE
jgi:thiamine kinase-like enzyme